MQTIKGITQSIENLQARIDAENRSAQQERSQAAEYRKSSDGARAQAHDRTAQDHERRALQMQDDIAKYVQEQEKIQAQITELDRKKGAALANRDDEVASYDSEITRLRGY